jgi:hypothetical protein
VRKSAGQIFLYAEEIGPGSSDEERDSTARRSSFVQMNVYISHRLVLGRAEDNQDLYRLEKLAGRSRRRPVRISDPDRRAAVRGGNPPDPRLITFVMTVAERPGCGTSRRHADLIRVGRKAWPRLVEAHVRACLRLSTAISSRA